MFFASNFGHGLSNSTIAAACAGLDEREAYVHAAALEGELDFEEVRSSSDAEWAIAGYSVRRDDLKLSSEERSFAADIIRDIESEFGEGPSDIWSAQDWQEGY